MPNQRLEKDARLRSQSSRTVASQPSRQAWPVSLTAKFLEKDDHGKVSIGRGSVGEDIEFRMTAD